MNRALILHENGDFDGAMALLKASENIYRELGNKNDLQANLGNQGCVLDDRGLFDQAMQLYKEQEQICRETGNEDGLQASLGNQALILQRRGDLDGALALHKEKERMCRALSNIEGLAISLANQSLVASRKKRKSEALALAEQANSLAINHGFAGVAEKFSRSLERMRREGATPISYSSGLASVAHPAADPDRAARLNIQYIEALKRWQALPWWKRLGTKKPERPTGI